MDSVAEKKLPDTVKAAVYINTSQFKILLRY
jgi:hypothetical protein